MQGVFVDGHRPKTKKEVKAAVADNPRRVTLERTAMLGSSEYDGPVTEMPEGKTAYVVGPDPYTLRKWYANVTRNGDKVTVR